MEDWVRVQMKTFTKWCNLHLRRARMKVTNLQEDLQNGIVLAALMEAISGDKIKVRKKCKLKIQQLENLNESIKYIGSKVKLVNIGAQDIHAGNINLILGLIWTIILRFEVAAVEIDGISGKKGLLLWCQRVTADYEGLGKKIKNFDRNWKDGNAFNAIVHHFRPDLMDYDEVKKMPVKDKLNHAFQLCDKEFGIPQLLDADDLDVPKPDEKIVMTYVAELYKYFTKKMAAESQIRGIKEAVAVTQKHDDLIDLYNSSATALKEWIHGQIAQYEANNIGGTADEIEANIKEMERIQEDVQPTKYAELHNLDNIISSLHKSEKLNSRPEWEAGEGLRIEELKAAWERMHKTGNTYNSTIRRGLYDYNKYKILLAKFAIKYKVLKEWIGKQSSFFQNNDINDQSVHDLETALMRCETFKSACTKFEPIVMTLESIAGQIDINHAEHGATQEKAKDAQDSFAAVKEEGEKFEAEMKELLEREKYLLKCAKEYAVKAGEFVLDLDEISDLTLEPVEAAVMDPETTEEKQKTMEAKIPEMAETLEGIRHMALELEEDRPAYIQEGQTFKDLTDKFESVKDALEKYARDLQAAKDKASSHDALNKQFADVANAYKDKVLGTSDALSKLDGTPEERLDQLSSLKDEYNGYVGDLDGVREAGKKCVDAGIVANPYTSESVKGLELLTKDVGASIDRVRDLIQQEADDNGSSLTKEQLALLNKTFDELDADKTGKLDEDNFKTACTALGLPIPDDVAGTLRQYGDGKSIDRDGLQRFMEDCFASGSTLQDVLRGFKALSGGDPKTIKVPVINQYFSKPEGMNTWIIDHASRKKGDDVDYVVFSNELFTR